MTITIETLLESKLQHRAHLDGPRGKAGWFGDIHACVEHPRLRRMVKYMRADRSTRVSWQVDGVDVGTSLANAVPALNVPPVLTAEEAAALNFVTPDWQDLRRAPLPGFQMLMQLDVKGIIEFEKGQCRLRPGSVFRLAETGA